VREEEDHDVVGWSHGIDGVLFVCSHFFAGLNSSSVAAHCCWTQNKYCERVEHERGISRSTLIPYIRKTNPKILGVKKRGRKSSIPEDAAVMIVDVVAKSDQDNKGKTTPPISNLECLEDGAGLLLYFHSLKAGGVANGCGATAAAVAELHFSLATASDRRHPRWRASWEPYLR
jgi:hypothetical protein